MAGGAAARTYRRHGAERRRPRPQRAAVGGRGEGPREAGCWPGALQLRRGVPKSWEGPFPPPLLFIYFFIFYLFLYFKLGLMGGRSRESARWIGAAWNVTLLFCFRAAGVVLRGTEQRPGKYLDRLLRDLLSADRGPAAANLQSLPPTTRWRRCSSPRHADFRHADSGATFQPEVFLTCFLSVICTHSASFHLKKVEVKTRAS